MGAGRAEWPAELVDALGDEPVDFVVRTRRLTQRRDARRTVLAGVAAGLLALMLLSVFIGPLLLGAEQEFELLGEPAAASRDDPASLWPAGLLVVFFLLPGFGLVLLGVLHMRREGAWVAATPTRFLVLRKGRVEERPWREVSPVMSLIGARDGGTVSIGEGRVNSLATLLRPPGHQIPDHAEAGRIAEQTWKRMAAVDGPAADTPRGPVPADAPERLRAALLDRDPDFVRKARRRGFVSSKGGVVGGGLLLLGLLVTVVGVLSFTGVLTVTETTGGAATEVPAGSPDHLPIIFFGLAFTSVALVFLYPTLLRPLSPGPWFAATPEGLVEVTSGRTRWYAWRAFEPDVERPMFRHSAVLLRLRPVTGQSLTPATHGSLALAGLEDPDRVAAALAARLGGQVRRVVARPRDPHGSGMS